MSNLPAVAQRVEDARTEIRPKHPKVTERQATLVETLLQDGKSIKAAAEDLGANRSWAVTTLKKPHVAAYAQEMAWATMAGLALKAISTKAHLLDNAKSQWLRDQIATDILDRAGMGQRPQQGAGKVVVNIDLGGK